MGVLTIKQVVLRITAIILLVELVIMFTLQSLNHNFGALTEAIIDATVLVLVSSPIIYIWVIKPFVNARNDALKKLESLAYTDHLTSLPNRRFFTTYMNKVISESTRHKYYGAVLLLDLDKFKPVNDTYGHEAGDKLLIEVAERLLANVREGDLVVRMGGDEFVVILSHLNNDREEASNEAAGIAQKLQALLDNDFVYENSYLKIGVSIGVRVMGVEKENIDTILQDADKAMYLAKSDDNTGIVLHNFSESEGRTTNAI